LSNATDMSSSKGRLYALMCWACSMSQVQEVVVARCHGILQRQMGWCPV